MIKIRHCVKYTLRSMLRGSMPKIRHISTSKPNRSVFRSLPSLIFGKYLLTTNIVSSGVLMWLGDIIQQEIEYRERKIKKRYDYGRMARMFTVGIALGPLHHYYYLYIAKILPKRDLSTVAVKIGLDQFMMSPICIILFFYSMGTMEKKPVEKMNEEIKNKFLEVYVMDWCVWVPTQFINFYYVPVKYQVLYINAVTMLYNVFLSYIKHKDQEQPEESIDKSLILVQTAESKKLS